MSGRKPGPPVQYYPLDARQMALACRKLARDMRAEHEAGMGPLVLQSNTNQYAGPKYISRWQAAWSLDRQAQRWEREAETGIPNTEDRAKIGW